MKRFFPLLSAVLVLTALFSCKTEENDTPSWKELSFAFQVDEPTATSVTFTITPDDDALTYFAHYIRKSAYVDDQTLKADDRALIEQLAADEGISFTEALTQSLLRGEEQGEIEGLDPDTEYILYAYRMDESGAADGAVARREFRTQLPPEPEVTFTFTTTNASYTSLTIATEASDPETLFCTDLMEAVYFEQLGGNESAVLQYFTELAAYTASSYDMTVEELVQAMSVRGSDEYEYKDLTQDTDYYAYAVIVDENGNISDRCAFQKVHTPAVEASDMTIAIFNKAKTTTDVLFIDASREFENGKNQNRLRDEDIDHIVTTYRRFAQGELKPGIVEERYAYVARREELADNDYNLNIPRYVDTFEEEPEIDIAAVQQEIEALEKELSEVHVRMDGYLKELGY